MNILIDAKELIKSNEKKQLVSVKMIIIRNKESVEYRGIFKETNFEFETDINFIENKKYDLIISMVILGKQIFKEKYSIKYNKSLEDVIKDNFISIKITDSNKGNGITQIQNLTYETYKKYSFKINPLTIIRKETEDKITIFLNDNIYILKGKLMQIINKIYRNNEFKEDIYKYNKLEDINLLILKGCIICYE